MKAILGLGNPGPRFRLTRHNLGSLVVRKLAQTHKIKINQRAFSCLLGQGTIEEQAVLLGVPLTFMNLSAEAVLPVVKRKRIKLSDLLIVCDDINLPLGKIRIRPKGSDGGHKGLRSIVQALASKDFARLRIGIDAPVTKAKAKRDKLIQHVLGTLNKKEIEVIKPAVDRAVHCCELWAQEGIGPAMARFN